MLTILHDRDDLNEAEVASSEGLEVRARSGATCEIAKRLLSMGYPKCTPVRIVRENPWLHGPLASITGITLLLASRMDFFADPEGSEGADLHSDSCPTPVPGRRSTVRR